MKVKNEFISFTFCVSLLVVTFLPTFSNGQYETPNDLCGGWFKSVRGSIQFRYSGTSMEDQVCAWTVSGTLVSQYARYDIRIQRLAGQVCNAETTKIAISHFSLWDQMVTATETWDCGGPQEYRAVPGTVFIVVLKTSSLEDGTGFQVEWSPNGDRLDHGGVRTTAYSWGKSSVDPLPYYASGFFAEEVATHVFPKGNNTKNYELEMQFQRIEISQCEDPTEGTGTCTPNGNSSMLVLSIQEDAKLRREALYTELLYVNPEPLKNEWGLVILIWGGNFWGAGGRFQMVYRSIRKPTLN